MLSIGKGKNTLSYFLFFGNMSVVCLSHHHQNAQKILSASSFIRYLKMVSDERVHHMFVEGNQSVVPYPVLTVAS